jgi:hypothetical protein
MALSCDPIAGQAVMRLTLDFVPEAGTQISATISRSVNGGPFENLVGYGLLCQQGVYYDTTAPLDVPLTYQVTANDGTFSQCSGSIDSGGLVWFKDPARPWANFSADLCVEPTTIGDPDCVAPVGTISLIRFGEEERAADATLFPILNTEFPIDVFGRRKGVTTSVQFASRTCEAIDQVYTLFTAGGPIFIQAPAAYCWPDRYLQPGDLKMTYISPDQRKPWRMWEVPLTELAPVFVNSAQGTVCANWCGIEENYATFADLTATGLSWLEIAQGDALC